MLSFNLILTIGLCHTCLLMNIAPEQSGTKCEFCVCLTKYFGPIRGKNTKEKKKQKKEKT